MGAYTALASLRPFSDMSFPVSLVALIFSLLQRPWEGAPVLEGISYGLWALDFLWLVLLWLNLCRERCFLHIFNGSV